MTGDHGLERSAIYADTPSTHPITQSATEPNISALNINATTVTTVTLLLDLAGARWGVMKI
jgi:hypothetical protein